MSRARVAQILVFVTIVIALIFFQLQSDYDVIRQVKTGLAVAKNPKPASQDRVNATNNTTNEVARSNITKNITKVVLKADDFIFQNISWDRSPIVVEEYNLIFFTLPKVACTVFKQLFRRIAGFDDWSAHMSTPGKEHLGLPHNPKFNGLRYLIHYNPSQANAMMLSPAFTRAIFVRDPKERLLSAYVDKAVNHNYVAKYCCSKRKEQNTTCWKEIQTFGGFVDGILPTCQDTHWNPQTDRMDRKYWKTIDFVGHMDTVKNDARRLLERIGAWDLYGKSGWGKHGNRSIFESDSNSPHITKAKTLLKKYYTRQTERTVEEFYREDYNSPVLNLTRRVIWS